MKKKYAEAIMLIGSCELDFKYSLREHSQFLQNLSFNALAFANFSLGNHDSALELYRRMGKDDPSTDMVAAQYNISICEGIMHYRKKNSDEALRCF
jgi:tetratricopeptide (TPR) repeat protein